MPNQKASVNTLRNPVYAIKSYALIFNDLANQYPDTATENAHKRLQHDVALLTEALQNFNAVNIETQLEQLPMFIQSTLLRAEQLNRLHANTNERLRNQLVAQEKSNATFLIYFTIIFLLVVGIVIISLIAKIRGMVKTLQLSEQRQRELKDMAEHGRSRLHALLSSMSIGVLFEDKRGHVEFTNPTFNRMWAIDANKPLVGQKINQLLEYTPHRFASPENASKYLLHSLDTGEISECREIEFSDGYILTQTSFPVLDTDKGLLGRLWIYEDITHERQTAQQLLHLAEHDSLTKSRFLDQIVQSPPLPETTGLYGQCFPARQY